jgi:PAS domain S-box-containing protein
MPLSQQLLPFSLSILILGGLLWLGVVLYRRWISPPPAADKNPWNESDPEDEARWVVASDGRTLRADLLARNWFTRPGVPLSLNNLSAAASPAQDLITLASREGQAVVRIYQRLYNVSSHRIGSNDRTSMEIRFHPLPGVAKFPASILKEAPPDFLRSTFSSLDVSKSAQNLLTALLPLSGGDWSMITLWDPIRRMLIPIGSRAAGPLDPSLELPHGGIRFGEGPSGWLARQRTPLRIPDLDRHPGMATRLPSDAAHFRSFLGYPLEISGELLGTFEFYSVNPSEFSEEILSQLAGPMETATLSLQNALVHENEIRREAEAQALADISRTVTVLSEPETFFDQLARALAPILDAQYIGFLLYDESTETLEPRKPFLGTPEYMLPLFRISLAAGSPARARWQSMESAIANGSEAQALLREFDLLPLDKALEIRSMGIFPLGPPGDTTGWLWIANKRGGPMEEEDVRRWTPLVTQSGRLIRNMIMLEEYRRQSDRADFVRRLSTFAASPSPLDEFLKQALDELARILGCDQAALFLLDESHDEIQLHAPSASGMSEEDKHRFATFSTADPLSRYAATFTMQPLLIRNAVHARDLPPYYRPWVDYFLHEHLIATPLLVRGRGIGELVAGRKTAAFNADQLHFLSSVGGQLAGTIEREQLFSATDASLRRRVDQLTSLTRVARELNTTIDLWYMLRLVYDESIRVTGADCGRIALLDPERKSNLLRPLFLLGEELPGETLSALESEVLDSGKSLLIRDMTAEQREADHSGVNSAILVPVVYQQRSVGLIDLHSRRSGWFDRESLEIIQAYGIQIAIAVGNAQRLEEQSQTTEMLRHRARLLSTIHQTGKASLSHTPLPKRLETITQSIHNTLGLTPVLIGLLQGDVLQWQARSGLSERAWQAVHAQRIPREVVVRWISARPDAEGVIPLPAIPGDEQPRKFAAELEDELGSQEILLLPLRTSEGELIGLAAAGAVSTTHPGAEYSFFEIFASQATVAIQTDMLRQALAKGRALRPAAGKGKRTPPAGELPTDAEMQNLQLRLNRLMALIQVTEFLSTQEEPQALLDTFAQKILESFSFDIVLVAEEGPGGPKLRLGKGKLPAQAQVEVLLGQRNPILSMFQRGQPILVLSLDDAPTWRNSPLLQALKTRSFLCFPIRTRQKIEAVALLISQEATSPLQPGDEDLFQLMGEQVAIYLENARLLEETRRRLREGNVLLEFSRRVSGLEIPSILQAVVDETRNAIPEAEGAMVALWEADRSAVTIRAVSGYANAHFLHQMACAAGEGLPGQAYLAAKPVHWAHVDMASDFNLSAANLEAYRNGTMGLIPASAMGVPLQAGDRTLGILLLENFTTAEAFSRNTEEVALSLANQTALALEKARLFQEMTDRTRELDERASHLALLNRLTNAAITTSNERTLLQIACRELAAAFDVPQSAAALIENGRIEAAVVAEYIYPGRPSAMSLGVPLSGSSVIETVLRTRSPLQVENAPTDERVGAFRLWIEQRQVISVLIMPLLMGGETAGLILIESPEEHSFSFADLSLAQTVSAQLGQALENVRLHQSARALTTDLQHRVVERTTALEREHQRAETLLRISTELVTSLDLNQVLTRALQLVNEAIGADQAAIVLLDPETQQLVYRASLEKDAPLPSGGRSLPFRAGEGLAGWVIQQRQSVILPDLANDPRWVRLYPEEPMRYHSALAVPLMVGADALGALILLSQDPSVFNPDQLRLASAAANQVAAAINNAELYRLIRDQAERLGGLVRSQQVESRKSRAMLEAIADGVMVTDDRNRIVLFNDAAEKLLGLRRDQVNGRAAGEFIGLFGKAGRAWQERLRRWQSAPAEITGGEYLAERITLDSGKVLSVHLAPVSSGEEFIGTVAVFRDITQDVEVDRLKSEFVATVSHELRTPMTAIKGYTEILMMGATGPLNDAQRQFLKIVKDNSDRLGLLVNDLLDISRIESGQTHLNIDVVEIPKLLEEIAAELRERCRSGGKSLEIVVQTEPDLPLIQADPSRVGEILGNLAENAFLYTPDGGKVTLQACAHADGVQIDVSDTGIGIGPTERERVFERFYRGEHPLVMATPGTGLGLPITKKLVEMHGGSITVESEGVPGKGSTFHVILPRDAVQF